MHLLAKPRSAVCCSLTISSLTRAVRLYQKPHWAQRANTTYRKSSLPLQASWQPDMASQPGAAAPVAAPQPPTVPPKPREEPAGVEAEASLLESFAQVPSVSKAWCFPAAAGGGGEGVRVALQLSQRNLPANAMRKYLLNFSVNEAVLEQGEVEASMPLELKDAVALCPSPSGRHMLVVRGGSGETAAVLEVWGRGSLLKELHVPKALHGGVYNDGWFGSGAVWSPDESRLAYVAEAPVPAKTPEWGARQGPDGKKWEGAAPKGWRGVGEWSEDWGELNTGKRHPALFVLDCTSWEVAAVQGLPEDASCGQPMWSPEGDMLLFVAWQHLSSNFPALSQRLGMVFCFNRPCALHAVPWPQQEPAAAAAAAGGSGGGAAAVEAAAAPASAVCITPSLSSAFSPRFGPPTQPPRQQQLVFLSQAAAVASGVHSATCALHSLSWQAVRTALEQSAPAPAPRQLVGPVWNAPGDEFPGLYCTSLPEQPFVAPPASSGGDSGAGEGEASGVVLMTTQWRSLTAVVAVDLSSGRVKRVTPANGACWSLLAAGGGWLIAQESTPGLPFRLYTAPVRPREASDPGAWSWCRLPLPWADEVIPQVVREHLDKVQTEILRLRPSVGAGEVPFEAVVLHRSDRPGPQPTIITPHGGPHTAYSAQFFMPLAFMTALGYNVVLLNYRGSTGFGEASIQSLPGNIGTNDVADCWDSLQAAIQRGYADPARVAVIGGSHGGFLTGHLVGQHPEAFRCAVLRNPVCDVSVMVHVSDIPDWCFVEGYGPEEGKRRAAVKPAPEELHKLRSISPAAHLHKVQCPMLFMLGAKDRRVPQEDAKQYIAALRARPDAPEVRVFVFPEDTHALDKPCTEFEQYVNAAAWLKQHCA